MPGQLPTRLAGFLPGQWVAGFVLWYWGGPSGPVADGDRSKRWIGIRLLWSSLRLMPKLPIRKGTPLSEWKFLVRTSVVIRQQLQGLSGLAYRSGSAAGGSAEHSAWGTLAAVAGNRRAIGRLSPCCNLAVPPAAEVSRGWQAKAELEWISFRGRCVGNKLLGWGTWRAARGNEWPRFWRILLSPARFRRNVWSVIPWWYRRWHRRWARLSATQIPQYWPQGFGRALSPASVGSPGNPSGGYLTGKELPISGLGAKLRAGRHAFGHQ